jgi:hypothetical protein
VRQWLEFLATVLGIAGLLYTLLASHLHVVLRDRPHVVAQ